MIKAVFIDMDDTLIATQVLYDYATAKLCGYLRHCGVAEKDTADFKRAMDRELYKTYGYSRQRFPQTFENVLKHFVPDADEEMVDIVRDFAESVFTSVAKEKPGIAEAISLLSQNYPVYIVTQGDQSVQENRLKKLSFLAQVADTKILKEKTPQAFAGYAAALGYAPEEVVMIGDSLKSDIVASTKAGMQAVWIEADNWSLETVTDLPTERMYKFFSLMDAARHITAHGTPAAVNTPQQPPENKPSPPKPH